MLIEGEYVCSMLWLLFALITVLATVEEPGSCVAPYPWGDQEPGVEDQDAGDDETWDPNSFIWTAESIHETGSTSTRTSTGD